MKQVIVRKGTIAVEDVAAPLVEPGSVLVKVQSSSVSVGTELSGIRASGTPLWRRALREPEKVRRVIDVAANQGVAAARDLVSGSQSGGAVTGYSTAGSVVEVGAGVEGYRVGDRVACAGAQSAHHAEFICVPENLTVSVPDGLSAPEASTVTLGAIALQGVRRAVPTLGETFVVVGLGVLGQLTAQLLRANGCRVIGIDLDDDRVRLARELGMDVGLSGDSDTDVADVDRLTYGSGADGVIVTASTPSSELLSQAFGMTRRKGRVVVVGDVGMDIDRTDIYEKELDFLISTSYGPGRYDQRYEDHGLDYPMGYVRWTENRNMQEYLRLVAGGQVQVAPLVGATFPLDEAAAAYEAVKSGSPRPVLVQLEYPATGEPDSRVVVHTPAARARSGRLGVALVGAGSFAKAVHLPNMRALEEQISLEMVVSRSGPNAADTAHRFGAATSTTDFQQALESDEVELVVITTRHDTHADMALRALQAGKHVLVEKPLALTRAELASIEAFYDEGGSDRLPILLTGFNRRFSEYATRTADLVAERSGPLLINYQMNAGFIPLDHWVHSPEGGGRNLGEACHIYDLFTYLTGARLTDVLAVSIHPRASLYGPTDNFVATASFDDGSVATLTYTAMGSPAVAKERMDVYVDGRVFQLDDYKRLRVRGATDEGVTSKVSEKGQREEVQAMVSAIRDGGEWPIPLWQQVQATELALRVQDHIANGAS